MTASTRVERDDEGSIYVLVLVVVLVVATAAVVMRDLGTGMLARWQAMQAAEDAADAAAQALDEPYYTTTGEVRLDPERAADLATAALDRDESMVAIAVDGDRVRVEVAHPARTVLISLGAITSSSTATLERGVTEAEP
ncbi:MAG: hypothetical protein QOF60_211 [Actinomycetota bacterium]|jgi:hypothetical protein|nr:hypothetical protein [Actinomycetota bacterium]